MKNNISYLVNGILAIAIIVLFILFFTSKKGEQTTSSVIVGNSDSTIAVLPIAFVNVDSLLTSYEYAKVSSERLMSKLKSTDNTIAGKQRQLEKEATDFQRKTQNNAFLSQEKYDQERQRIEKMSVDLQQMAQRLNNELEREQSQIHENIADSVQVCIELYNKTANYEIIFSSQGMNNILTAKEAYNVTDAVLQLLNSRYKASEAK